MKNKALFLLLTSSLLAFIGCSDSKNVSQPTIYGEGGVSNEMHTEKEDQPSSIEVIPKAEMSTGASQKGISEADNDWEPNEGHLVQAGELIMDLKRNLGYAPTVSEMQTCLQKNMGLTRVQVNKVLEELGLS